MRRALRNSLVSLLALSAVSAHPARPIKEDAARREMEQAERAGAAEQAARQEAAARAAAATAEARRLSEERIVAAARLRQAEAATAEAAARMDALAAQRRRAQAELEARAETLQPLLPLIERLALYPAETLLAVPAPPEDTLRGLLVLRGLAAQVGRDALALRHEQTRLAAAGEAMAAEAPRLAAALARQQAEAAALDRQIAAAVAGRRDAEGDAAAAARRAAENAARAESLRGMLTELEAQHRAQQARAANAAARAEHRKPIEAAAAGAAPPRGLLVVPVAGAVVRAWGDATEGGPAMGLSYQPPPAARVVSPCRGRVAFAARFRSYGLLLIVDCGGGYHAVLAGFERLDVKVGQDVLAGEPVGVMPAWQPGAVGNRPTLYVELRRDGQPVNPAPWLRATG
jgi:septal ring factor EnvC (AmiA/AmiB activator)